MGEVIKFVDQIVKHRGKEARQAMGHRLYGRHRQRHQRMLEAAEKRKRQEDTISYNQYL